MLVRKILYSTKNEFMNDFRLLRKVPNINEKICFIGDIHERHPRIFPPLAILSHHSVGEGVLGGPVAMPALGVGKGGGVGAGWPRAESSLLECRSYNCFSLFILSPI